MGRGKLAGLHAQQQRPRRWFENEMIACRTCSTAQTAESISGGRAIQDRIPYFHGTVRDAKAFNRISVFVELLVA